MRFCVQVKKEDLIMLQELEQVTGIDKNSIVSILIGEVYSSYKCSVMSGDPDYMLMQLSTKEFEQNIKSRSKSKKQAIY